MAEEDMSPWLIQIGENDETGDPIYGLIVDADGNIPVCDTCPCKTHCWYQYTSSCSMKVDERTGEQEVEWSTPALTSSVCRYAPEVVKQWYWTGNGMAAYWAKGAECDSEGGDACDAPPGAPDPDLGDCCNYIPIGKSGELPYIWEKQFIGYDEHGEPIYRYYKQYSDIDEANAIYLGGTSASDCEWVTWDVSVASVQGTITARYTCSATKSKTIGLGSYKSQPFTASLKLSPGWSVALYLHTTNLASYYNWTWRDGKNPENAYYFLNTVGQSSACATKYYIEFRSSCRNMSSKITWCQIATDPAPMGPSSSSYHPPFPYNRLTWSTGTFSNSGWAHQDEENPDGPYRALEPELEDTDGSLLQIICGSSHFPRWSAGGRYSYVDPSEWETPRNCDSDDPDDGCPGGSGLECKCCLDPFFRGFSDGSHNRYRSIKGEDGDICVSIEGGVSGSVMGGTDACYAKATGHGYYKLYYGTGEIWGCNALKNDMVYRVIGGSGGEVKSDAKRAVDGCGPEDSIYVELDNPVEFDWATWDEEHGN